MPEIRKSNRPRQGIFISYARSDGKNFADDLRRRLIDEYHFQAWQDIVELEGGKDWWLQIEAAIKSVEFLVMVMTPGALASQTTRKEWRLARQEGVCVLPVIAEAIDFTTLPRWMRDTHFFDFKFPEQWERFIRTLQSPCQAPRVPFMVEDKPDDFIERPEEFNQLLALLLDPKREEPITITAALRGAGGYGKTTLAKALCHDEAIQNAFDDGILWVTLGENPGDLTGRVEDLIYTLNGERPGFSSVQAAAARLAELLADRDILLVIDDVWNSAHLRPFLQGGSRCSRLITTRNSDTLPAKARGIDLDAMRPDEATSLLGFNLPDEGENSGLQHLAQRLGEWPLLLKLVNATLRYRVHDLKQSFAAAIAYVNAAFDECGLIAFDQDNATERHQAVAKTLEVSLQMLDEGSRQRYFELAIFPEDVNIPLVTLEKLWSAAGYKPIHTEKLCEKLHKLSLLLHFDLSDCTIRLHDVMRQYLVQKTSADLPKLHARFLDAYRSTTSMQNWANLPADEPYLWRNLVYHLHEGGQRDLLRQLLFDYDWLRNKLQATDINAVLAGFGFLSDDDEAQLLQSALRLSANQLSKNPQQLAPQLIGRLQENHSETLQSLLRQAVKRSHKLWLRPLTASLTPPGGPLLRTLEGHSHFVRGVALTPDGRAAVSASDDHTLKVWDLRNGVEIRTLKGHSGPVYSAAITPDGRAVVSASMDGTLKVWDLRSGVEIRTLKGRSHSISSVAITPDGRAAVSASSDHTFKVWDLHSGEEIRTLKGHSGEVNSVAITPDGRVAVSASSDHTLKVWDLHSGEEIRTLKGHSGPVYSIAITPDGRVAVSASYDKTLKVWDLHNGEEIRMLKGHSSVVGSVALMPDGRTAVSASWDKTLKVWDLYRGEEIRTLKGHSGSVVNVVITPDGRAAVSASNDDTLKVWDLHRGEGIRTLKGHSDSVISVAITLDGRAAVSASTDDTLKVWDLHRGEEIRTLKGHSKSVYSIAITSIAITPDDQAAVVALEDGTLKVWNLHNGQEIRMLKGDGVVVYSITITPDGRAVVLASGDTLKVLDLHNGQEIRTLTGHSDSVWSVAITPDGQRAVSASEDHTLKVWDFHRGEEIQTLEGHSDRVLSVAVSPDGRAAVSASGDNSVKVWDLHSGEEVACFIGESPIRTCAIAPDSKTIVAGEDSGRMHFLRLEGVGGVKKQQQKVKCKS